MVKLHDGSLEVPAVRITRVAVALEFNRVFVECIRRGWGKMLQFLSRKMIPVSEGDAPDHF